MIRASSMCVSTPQSKRLRHKYTPSHSPVSSSEAAQSGCSPLRSIRRGFVCRSTPSVQVRKGCIHTSPTVTDTGDLLLMTMKGPSPSICTRKKIRSGRITVLHVHDAHPTMHALVRFPRSSPPHSFCRTQHTLTEALPRKNRSVLIPSSSSRTLPPPFSISISPIAAT